MALVHLVLRGLINSGFSQSHKITNINIIANLVFPYLCSFLTYLMLVNVISVYISALYLKVANFIGLVHFRWHSYNKVGNIGILLLWRASEKNCIEFRLTYLELYIQKQHYRSVYFFSVCLHLSFREYAMRCYHYFGT